MNPKKPTCCLRQNAIELYASLLKERTPSKLPRILLETMAWCLGEYGYLSSTYSLEEILQELCTLASKSHLAAPTTRKCLLTAIMKLVAQAGTCPPHTAAVIDDYTRSQDVDLQQRCLEFQHLLTAAPHVLGDVLPVDASCEDLDVDENLSFLNNFVHEALQNGASPYDKPEDDDDDDEEDAGASGYASAFKMTPYEKPQTPSTMSHLMRGVGSDGAAPSGVSLPPGSGYSGTAHGNSSGGASVGANGELTLNTRNVANVWGKGGLAAPAAAAAPPPATASAPASAYGMSPSGPSGFGQQAPAPSGYGGFGAPACSSSRRYRRNHENRRKRNEWRLLYSVDSYLEPNLQYPVVHLPRFHLVFQVRLRLLLLRHHRLHPLLLLPKLIYWTCHLMLQRYRQVLHHPTMTFYHLLQYWNQCHLRPLLLRRQLLLLLKLSLLETTKLFAERPAPPSEPVDPFAASGLLGDFDDKPLASLETSTKFEYNGTPMAPLDNHYSTVWTTMGYVYCHVFLFRHWNQDGFAGQPL